jgi:hypothetical protein
MPNNQTSMHEQQELEEQQRLNQSRERVLTRLWAIADLDPERTRNSMSAQIKAISMIVAIEGLIPDRNTNRRAGATSTRPTAPPVHPQSAESTSDSSRDKEEPRAAADVPADQGPNPAETIPSIGKKPDTLRLRL